MQIAPLCRRWDGMLFLQICIRSSTFFVLRGILSSGCSLFPAPHDSSWSCRFCDMFSVNIKAGDSICRAFSKLSAYHFRNLFPPKLQLAGLADANCSPVQKMRWHALSTDLHPVKHILCSERNLKFWLQLIPSFKLQAPHDSSWWCWMFSVNAKAGGSMWEKSAVAADVLISQMFQLKQVVDFQQWRDAMCTAGANQIVWVRLGVSTLHQDFRALWRVWENFEAQDSRCLWWCQHGLWFLPW